MPPGQAVRPGCLPAGQPIDGVENKRLPEGAQAQAVQTRGGGEHRQPEGATGGVPGQQVPVERQHGLVLHRPLPEQELVRDSHDIRALFRIKLAV